MNFDSTGEYLAVADKGGRVIVFGFTDLKDSRYFDYSYVSEIQSHEPEFDHLSSVELDERINAVEFLKQPKQSTLVQLLSTNDRIIKLWKLENRSDRQYSSASVQGGKIMFPKAETIGAGIEGVERK